MAQPAQTAVRVERLSKRYRIGPQRARYRTLREAIMDGLSAALQRLRAGGAQAQQTIWALRDVSLDIASGDVVGIVGPNAAGKTTLLKVLSRITEPTEGRVEVRGRVGSLLEVGTGFHPELTGRENIHLNGAILGMTRHEVRARFDEIVDFAEMGQFIDTPIKRYSAGMGMRLAFAVAAHLQADILAVDEVLAVGDMAFRKKCLGKMQDVSRHGRTVLLVSHDMNAIRRLCRTGVWLERGRLRAVGEARDVVRQYEESVAAGNGPTGGRAERTDRPASPKCFEWVSLTGADGRPAASVGFGDRITLTAAMGGRTVHGTHFVEWFLNERAHGHRVAWGGTHALPTGDVAGDSKHIAFVIGPLALAEGQYSFSLAMGVAGVADLDFWPEAISFEVASCDPNRTGYSYTARYAPTFIPYEVRAA